MHPILARTFFRIHERMLGRNTFAVLAELEKSQWWPRERLEQLRVDRLARLVASAYRNTPYWRAVMDEHGIDPSGIDDLETLGQFPLLEKATLRDRREEMVWRGEGPRVRIVRTSGSTNEALQFYTSSGRESCISAGRMRGHRWMGIDVGEKEVYFWAAPVELHAQDLLKKFRDVLKNDLLTNALEMSPEIVPWYVKRWKRWKAKCLFGYPSSFVLMASMAREQGLDLTQLKAAGVRAICTTSEMLGEENRQPISEAFGLPVYDSYGVREGAGGRVPRRPSGRTTRTACARAAWSATSASTSPCTAWTNN